MSTKATQLREELHAKQQALHEFAGEGKHESFTKEQIEQARAMTAELKDLNARYQEAHELELSVSENERELKNWKTPVNGLPNGGDGKAENPFTSLGEAFVNSAAFKSRIRPDGNILLTQEDEFGAKLPALNYKSANAAEFKTTMTTSAGYAPANNRTNIVILSAQNQPMVQNLIPSSPTNQTSIPYMVETTFTNTAAAKAEDAAGVEATLAFTPTSAAVEYIKGYLPVSERQLMSVAGIESLINDRLSLMLAQELEDMLLNGNGTPPQIQGFYGVSGLQTYAKTGGDTVADAIYNGIRKIRFTGRANPDNIIIHPNDWQDVRLMKNANGDYIWGNPAVAVGEQIWGVPVTVTTSAIENSALVGSFRQYSHISVFEEANVKIALINDQAIKNLLTFVMTMQASLEIYRPAAFCTVTSI